MDKVVEVESEKQVTFLFPLKVIILVSKQLRITKINFFMAIKHTHISKRVRMLYALIHWMVQITLNAWYRLAQYLRCTSVKRSLVLNQRTSKKMY